MDRIREEIYIDTAKEYNQIKEEKEQGEWYNGDGQEGYYIKESIYHCNENGEHFNRVDLVPTGETIINNRIKELRIKLINGTITEEEREELKLLIG